MLLMKKVLIFLSFLVGMNACFAQAAVNEIHDVGKVYVPEFRLKHFKLILSFSV